MQQNNLDLMTRSLIELAQEASKIRHLSNLDALKRLYAIEREQIRRIMEQQEEVHAQKETR